MADRLRPAPGGQIIERYVRPHTDVSEANLRPVGLGRRLAKLAAGAVGRRVIEDPSLVPDVLKTGVGIWRMFKWHNEHNPTWDPKVKAPDSLYDDLV